MISSDEVLVEDTPIVEWLSALNLSQYSTQFIKNGYLSVRTLREGPPSKEDLIEIGITLMAERNKLHTNIKKLCSSKTTISSPPPLVGISGMSGMSGMVGMAGMAGISGMAGMAGISGMAGMYNCNGNVISIMDSKVTRNNSTSTLNFLTPSVALTQWCGHDTLFIQKGNGTILEIHGNNRKHLLTFDWTSDNGKNDGFIGTWFCEKTTITISETLAVFRAKVSQAQMVTPHVLRLNWCGHDTCFVLRPDGVGFKEVHGDNRDVMLEFQWTKIKKI